MKITKNIDFNNFKNKVNQKSVYKNFKLLIKNKNEIINSLTPEYKYRYSKNLIKKLKKSFYELRVIGMGGSILGLKAIYFFLISKLKKKIYFIDNLVPNLEKVKSLKKPLNLIISKSGNTLETISNTNILVKKNHKNVFITENKKNYLRILANKLKADVIDHKKHIEYSY